MIEEVTDRQKLLRAKRLRSDIFDLEKTYEYDDYMGKILYSTRIELSLYIYRLKKEGVFDE